MIPESAKRLIKDSLQCLLGNKLLIYRVINNRAEVALTFDDGPNPVFTPKVLDILNENNVKATFFVTGINVERYPDIAKRILAEGHSLGNHSYSHVKWSQQSFGEHKDEILKTQKIIFEAFGVRASVFRPPQGHLTVQQLFFCFTHSIRVILWSYDTMDYKYKGDAFLKDRIAKTQFTNGDILLLHDDNIFTVDTLQFLINKLTLNGFDFIKL